MFNATLFFCIIIAPDDCQECEKILHELENIDDETDDHGIMFVTTDDMTIAKKEAKINKFPAVVLFRNGVPMIYKGKYFRDMYNNSHVYNCNSSLTFSFTIIRWNYYQK